MLITETPSAELFPGLDRDASLLLMRVLTRCVFQSNQTIFNQGQKADQFYLLISGKVSIVYKPYDAPEITVAHIEPGGVFGWSAAMGRPNYSSAAISVSQSRAYCISHRQIAKIYRQDPETGIILLSTLADGISKRLNSTHEQVLTVLIQGIDEQKYRPGGSCGSEHPQLH